MIYINIPKNNNDWGLVVKDDLKYLESKLLLSYGFRHAFFTKESNNIKPIELLRYLGGSSEIYKVSQIHSNKVITASQSKSINSISADGIISDKSNQSLWIYSADCIPLLFGDPASGVVGACHAGWKGLSKNIIGETLKKMELLQCKRSEIVVAIGPAISIKNYQVGEEVVIAISKTLGLGKSSTEEIELFMNKLGITNRDKESRKVFLGLTFAAYYQLIQQGVVDERISISPYCTFNDDKLFNSWRRQKEKKLQWSCIIS